MPWWRGARRKMLLAERVEGPGPCHGGREMGRRPGAARREATHLQFRGQVLSVTAPRRKTARGTRGGKVTCKRSGGSTPGPPATGDGGADPGPQGRGGGAARGPAEPPGVSSTAAGRPGFCRSFASALRAWLALWPGAANTPVDPFACGQAGDTHLRLTRPPPPCRDLWLSITGRNL